MNLLLSLPYRTWVQQSHDKCELLKVSTLISNLFITQKLIQDLWFWNFDGTCIVQNNFTDD